MAMVVFLILYICCRGVPAAGAPPAPARAARAEIPPMASAIVIEESERKYSSSKARVIPAAA